MPLDHVLIASAEDVARAYPPASKEPAEDLSLVDQPERRGSGVAELMASAVRLVRGLLHSRSGIVVASGLVVAGSLAVGWEWLAVAGVLPLVLSVLPCVAMCALGLCMMKGGDGKSCSTQKDSGSKVVAKPPGDRL